MSSHKPVCRTKKPGCSGADKHSSMVDPRGRGWSSVLNHIPCALPSSPSLAPKGSQIGWEDFAEDPGKLLPDRVNNTGLDGAVWHDGASYSQTMCL